MNNDSSISNTLIKGSIAENIGSIRESFPILNQQVNGYPLVYFDNAATSQKPLKVIEALTHYYSTINSNIHRGVHYLSEKATAEYEDSREKAREFINAKSITEINFVRGTTEGINLVAHSLGRKIVTKDSEIIITAMEHHSNIVPWQILAEEKNAKLRVAPINDRGELEMEVLLDMINEKTAIIAMSHISNTLGTVNPIETVIKKAHEFEIPVVIDGAQGVPHTLIDVQKLDCDFYTFSSHKMFGPTGAGILYGKEKWLEKMDPYQGGGEMIQTVTFEKTTYNELPYKFEAGTPNIADGIVMGTAMDYINSLGIHEIEQYEQELLEYGTERLKSVEGIRFIGEAEKKASLISFVIEGIHPYDIGVLLDKQGIAIRTGHLCTEPLMERFGIPGTCRASFAFYNTTGEIDRMMEALEKAVKMLR